MTRRRLLAWALFGALASAIAPARADAPPPPPPAAPALDLVLAAAGRHAQRFEEMRRRGSFTLAGHVDELSQTGAVAVNKDLVVRVTANGSDLPLVDVVRYTENGADKTGEAKRKAEERRAKKKRTRANDFHLPFHPDERARYAFSVAERDDKTKRMRVAFAPHAPARDAYRGSAWIDETSGEVLSMAFLFTKTPAFVDRVAVALVFDQPTPLGRAPSALSFDARGGLLVVQKHFRGTARITDVKID